MSIDARVQSVVLNEDGSGDLILVDRPARPRQTPGIAGQRSLAFDSAPDEVTALTGMDIWGGANSIMLGDCEIARRVGYTSITFCVRAKFVEAVATYNERRRRGEILS